MKKILKGVLIFALSAVMMCSSSTQAFAEGKLIYGTPDKSEDQHESEVEKNNEQNNLNIDSYDSEDDSTYYSDATTGTVTASVNSTVTGNALAAKIYDYLISQGFTPQSACGIMGNIERESSFNPSCGSENEYYGLFQVGSNALSRMKAYCEDNDLNYTDGMAQVKAMVNKVAAKEFKDYTGGGTIFYWGTQSAIKDSDNHLYEPYYVWWNTEVSLDEFKQLTDIKFAAELWRRVVERDYGSTEDISKRISYAQAYYALYINGSTSSGTSDSGSGSNKDTSTNNQGGSASGSGSGQSKTSEKKKK